MPHWLPTLCWKHRREWYCTLCHHRYTYRWTRGWLRIQTTRTLRLYYQCIACSVIYAISCVTVFTGHKKFRFSPKIHPSSGTYISQKKTIKNDCIEAQYLFSKIKSTRLECCFHRKDDKIIKIHLRFHSTPTWNKIFIHSCLHSFISCEKPCIGWG